MMMRSLEFEPILFFSMVGFVGVGGGDGDDGMICMVWLW
jgi:hypothetical protein